MQFLLVVLMAAVAIIGVIAVYGVVEAARKKGYVECMMHWCEYGMTLDEDGSDLVFNGVKFVEDRAERVGINLPKIPDDV